MLSKTQISVLFKTFSIYIIITLELRNSCVAFEEMTASIGDLTDACTALLGGDD